MLFDVYFMSSRSHAFVNLHAWDPAGDVRDASGTQVSAGLFRFTLDMSATDLRTISLKFWFPDELQQWESDDYVRRPAVASSSEVWTAEFSARCMYEDPRPTPPLPQGAVVSFGVLTAQKFAGGRLYAWNPGGSESGSFAESARDAVRGLSTFAVTLDRWMTGGFHFKLVTAGGKFEPESCNRYWRPADGTTPYLKAGQVALHPACPEPVLTPITVTMPAASTQPTLLIRDEVDDFHAELAPVWTREIDAQFVACRFERSIYPQARYLARIKTAAYDPGYDLPLVVGATQGGAPERFGVLGVSEWLAAQPVRDAAVTLVVHPNPTSGFPDEIEVPWRIGRPPQTRFEPPGVPGGTAMAKRGPDGSWAASLELFGGVPQYFDLLRTPGGLTESRADGPVLSQRAIRPAADETSVHTIDGQSGLSTRGPLEFADLAFDQRAALMRRAFSPEIADAGTFAPHELPHGATWNGEDLWFVLFAPHAVRVELVLLDRAASTPAGRVTREHALRLTSDLRYWWCKVARRSSTPRPGRPPRPSTCGRSAEKGRMPPGPSRSTATAS
jgi:hypothetical protein